MLISRFVHASLRLDFEWFCQHSPTKLHVKKIERASESSFRYHFEESFCLPKNDVLNFETDHEFFTNDTIQDFSQGLAL